MDTSYSLALLVQACFDCLRHKRNTPSALRFMVNLERNLIALDEDLQDGTYRPGRSICFAITRPKPREVWAADFRDRIVHHLIYNHLAPKFIPRFIADSCACIPGRGTLYGAKRVQGHARSVTENWQQPAMYVKGDFANFFVSVDKRVLWPLLANRLPERWWRDLTRTVLFHDPRTDVEIHGSSSDLARVPPHKRLMNAPADHGLPIGNLSSQFFANVLLNPLDQFVKHRIRARYYARYVDDWVLLHQSAGWLESAYAAVQAYLPTLRLSLNPTKKIIQPVARGIDFAGFVIKPHRLVVRRRTLCSAIQRIETVPIQDAYETGNSYLGLLRHADSHHDRAKLANALRKRGLTVNAAATKCFPPAATDPTPTFRSPTCPAHES
ncbi:RNA-directed DNA polymerase [Achromobacter aloeverae]